MGSGNRYAEEGRRRRKSEERDKERTTKGFSFPRSNAVAEWKRRNMKPHLKAVAFYAFLPNALAAGNARFKYPLSEWKSQARQKIQDSPSKYCIQRHLLTLCLHALISVRLDRCEQEAITEVIPGGKRFSPHHLAPLS